MITKVIWHFNNLKINSEVIKMKNQIREFIIELMMAEHRMFTLSELYDAVRNNHELRDLLPGGPLLIDEQRMRKIVREAIYEKSIYRFLSSHKHEYIFMPKHIEQTLNNKFGLIQLCHEYIEEFREI
jgi:hypothetical protein